MPASRFFFGRDILKSSDVNLASPAYLNHLFPSPHTERVVDIVCVQDVSKPKAALQNASPNAAAANSQKTAENAKTPNSLMKLLFFDGQCHFFGIEYRPLPFTLTLLEAQSALSAFQDDIPLRGRHVTRAVAKAVLQKQPVIANTFLLLTPEHIQLMPEVSSFFQKQIPLKTLDGETRPTPTTAVTTPTPPAEDTTTAFDDLFDATLCSQRDADDTVRSPAPWLSFCGLALNVRPLPLVTSGEKTAASLALTIYG